jgi:telomere length regulation protein
MILNGLFPSSNIQSSTVVSYFSVNRQLYPSGHVVTAWGKILQQSTWTNRQSIVSSLFAAIKLPDDVYDTSTEADVLIDQGGRQVFAVLNNLAIQGELADQLERTLARFSWNIFLGRVTLAWLNHSMQDGTRNLKVWDGLFDKLLGTWTSKEHIEHSLISQHQGNLAYFICRISNTIDRVINFDSPLPLLQGR